MQNKKLDTIIDKISSSNTSQIADLKKCSACYNITSTNSYLLIDDEHINENTIFFDICEKCANTDIFYDIMDFFRIFKEVCSGTGFQYFFYRTAAVYVDKVELHVPDL